MKYRVYYNPNSCHGLATFDGDESNWFEAPIHEVIVILQEDKEHGRKLLSGGDYYIWEGETIGWISCDRDTMYQYMARPGRDKRFLLGVMVSNELWNTIMKEARLTEDFPKQTALRKYEARVHFSR